MRIWFIRESRIATTLKHNSSADTSSAFLIPLSLLFLSFPLYYFPLLQLSALFSLSFFFLPFFCFFPSFLFSACFFHSYCLISSSTKIYLDKYKGTLLRRENSSQRNPPHYFCTGNGSGIFRERVRDLLDSFQLILVHLFFKIFWNLFRSGASSCVSK